MKWIGLKNYYFTVTDPIFWISIKNTMLYAVFVTVMKNLFGLFLAFLLAKNLIGRSLFRTATYMPVTFSYVVVGILWSWIFNPTFGILNAFLGAVGLESWIQGWLSDPNIAMFSVMWVDIWKTELRPCCIRTRIPAYFMKMKSNFSWKVPTGS